MRIIKLILIVIFYHLTISSYSQAVLKIEIEQIVLPGPNHIIKYNIQNKHLNVYQIKTHYRDTLEIKNNTKIYSLALNTEQIDSLKIIVEKILNANLNSRYSTEMLDGITLKFEITFNNITKKFVLENYNAPIFDSLLSYINRQLPKKKRVISF